MERHKSSNTVTIEEQRAQGLTRQTTNFIPAVTARRAAPPMPINSQVGHVIDVAPTATQHIEVRTSAVDRAKGFLIASIPLYVAFATAVVGVVVLGFKVPLASLATLVIFLLAFVAAWVVGYTYTLQVSAEGVSLFEAKNKWDVIQEEQRRRWEHYDKLMGDE